MKKKITLPLNHVVSFCHLSDKTYQKYLSNINDYSSIINSYKNNKEEDYKVIKNKLRVPKRKGLRFTYCALLDTLTGMGTIGIETCYPADNFSRKTGRDRSLAKSMFYPNKKLDIGYTFKNPNYIINIPEFNFNSIDFTLLDIALTNLIKYVFENKYAMGSYLFQKTNTKNNDIVDCSIKFEFWKHEKK